MAKTYGADINLDIDTAHTRVIRMVGDGKRVLELGCGIGHMTAVFAARGCAVVAIEASLEAAERARTTGARIILGDLDTLDWAEALGADRFDVIVAADVLEHLRDPVAVLIHAAEFLADEGTIVASIPNIGHLSVVAELLQGRFPYGPSGLLDDSHIRFFTRDSVYACFEDAGFEIVSLERVIVRPEETEFRTDLAALPSAIVTLLESREEATTYQFIVTGSRSARSSHGPKGARQGARTASRTAPAPRAANASTHDVAELPLPATSALEGFLQAMASRWAFVESDRQHHAALAAKLREQLMKSETHIGWLTSEVERSKLLLDRSRQEADADAGQRAVALAEATARVDALRRDVDVLTSRVAASVSEAERLRSDAERARMDGVALRAESDQRLEDLTREFEDARRAQAEEMDALQHARAAAMEGAQRAHTEQVDALLRAHAQRIEERQRAHAQQLEALRRSHDEHRADLERANEATSRRLIAERLRFGVELELAQQERHGLVQQFEGLRRALAVYERSRSWRLTAPIRWGARVARRLLTGTR